MSTDADLDAVARRVIDTNHYMTLGTRDRGGRPRLSPVYYTAARYTDFYWVSSPGARHSRNVAEHPEIEIVIFDSTALVGEGEAVYLAATARGIRPTSSRPFARRRSGRPPGRAASHRTNCAEARRSASTWRRPRPARSTCAAAIPSTAAAWTRVSRPTRRA